jgi:hypothetical protein
MANGLGRRELDLLFGFGWACRLVDQDAELAILREEAARHPIAIPLEGHGLDREFEGLATNDDSNEAEQPTRNLGIILGSVLHAPQPKAESWVGNGGNPKEY